VIYYASRTGTKRNLAAMRARDWGLLISATGVHRDEGFSEICIDNGAWTSFNSGEPWREDLFRRLVASHGKKARFIVVPDIVEGGPESLALSIEWLGWCLECCKMALIPVQDGMTDEDVESLLGPRVGVFVGGSTEFKERTVQSWGRLCRKSGAWLHVGRVNTVRRIKLCIAARADSADGSSGSRFAVNIPRLDHARRLMAFDF